MNEKYIASHRPSTRARSFPSAGSFATEDRKRSQGRAQHYPQIAISIILAKHDEPRADDHMQQDEKPLLQADQPRFQAILNRLYRGICLHGPDPLIITYRPVYPSASPSDCTWLVHASD